MLFVGCCAVADMLVLSCLSNANMFHCNAKNKDANTFIELEPFAAPLRRCALCVCSCISTCEE